MSSSPSFSYSFSDNPLDPESGVLMPLHIDLSGTAAGKFLMCQPEGETLGRTYNLINELAKKNNNLSLTFVGWTMNSDEKSTRTFEGPSAHSHTQIEMNNRTL